MTSLSKRFGVLAVVTTALIACGSGGEVKSPSSSGAGDHAEVGKPAPDLAIQTLNDKGKISLPDLQGKVVIVDFWATWCGPCKQSFPKLEELSKKVGDKVVIVGVSVDDEKKGVAEFAKENGATFAIGWDEGHSIASRWKVGTMPTTFIVDPTGKVRHIHDGYHDGETSTMEKEATALLAEGGGDTKVAKNDNGDGKGDSKGDGKGDGGKGDKGDSAKPAVEDKPAEDTEEPPKKPKKKKKKPAKPKK